MQKNSGDFSTQELMQLANSPAGKQLLALLQQSDPAVLRAAMTQAAQGQYTQAKELLTPLMESQQARSLLQQLGGKDNG